MKDEKSSSIEDVLKSLDYQSSEPEVDSYYHEQMYAILQERHKKEIIKSALVPFGAIRRSLLLNKFRTCGK